MLVAVTRKQWRALVAATGLEAEMAALSHAQAADLDDEHTRFALQSQIAAHLQVWAGQRDLAQIAQALDGTPVCWSPYRDTAQMLAEDPRASTANPIFVRQSHPGVAPLLTPRSPLRMSNHPSMPAGRAPVLDPTSQAAREWEKT